MSLQLIGCDPHPIAHTWNCAKDPAISGCLYVVADEDVRVHRSYSPFGTVASQTESREDTVLPGPSGIKPALDTK